MAHAQEEVIELKPLDAEDIGWWMESVDERKYGPVSRETLRRFLAEGIISPNTLVRHCTQAEARPVVDQHGMTDGLTLPANAPVSGDRLEEAWPRKKGDRLALAQGTLPCSRHRRAAVAVCVRCHAPYCHRCHVRPFHRSFFFCKRCQSSNHNRRFMALLADSFLFIYVPMFVFGIVGAILGGIEIGAIYIVQLIGTIVFLVRDALFGGAGPGKRLVGLRVVRSKDGKTPLGFGQGIVRWLSQFIPIFNLVDAFAPLGDRLQRRYGDRWAKTRVIDTARRLERSRRGVRRKLAKKGVTLETVPGLTIEEFARLP